MAADDEDVGSEVVESRVVRGVDGDEDRIARPVELGGLDSRRHVPVVSEDRRAVASQAVPAGVDVVSDPDRLRLIRG